MAFSCAKVRAKLGDSSFSNLLINKNLHNRSINIDKRIKLSLILNIIVMLSNNIRNKNINNLNLLISNFVKNEKQSFIKTSLMRSLFNKNNLPLLMKSQILNNNAFLLFLFIYIL